MLKVISLIMLLSLFSGCAGTGFNKKATLMPDQVGFEADLNPQDNFNSKEITGRVTWNLK